MSIILIQMFWTGDCDCEESARITSPACLQCAWLLLMAIFALLHMRMPCIVYWQHETMEQVLIVWSNVISEWLEETSWSKYHVHSNAVSTCMLRNVLCVKRWTACLICASTLYVQMFDTRCVYPTLNFWVRNFPCMLSIQQCERHNCFPVHFNVQKDARFWICTSTCIRIPGNFHCF